MAFDLAATLARTRRIVHDTMALDAEYWDRTLAVPVPLRVRYHTRQHLTGDIGNDGYGMVIDSIDKIIFDIDELAVKGVELKRGGTVKLTSPLYRGATFNVDTQEESEGPVDQPWRVVKA